MARSLRVLFVVVAAGAIRLIAAQDILPSGLFPHDQLAARTSGPTEIRQMMTGKTHSGCLVDLHETALASGQMPHAPHHHVHEEMLLIREGTLEVTVKGKTEQLGPGSAVYIASNEDHGWKNVGPTQAKYFVVALGDDKQAGSDK